MLDAEQLSLRRHGRTRVDQVSLQLRPGRLHLLLGANGAGKSSLLALLAGLHAPSSGTLRLNGRPMAQWTFTQLARQRALLPQQDQLQFAVSALEVTQLGRYAAGENRVAAEAALAETDALSLAQRPYTELSQGERARVRLARVLAQLADPPAADLAGCTRVLLLDEPTASLDPPHQHLTMRIAQQRACAGYAVLMAVQDPNLALQYADEVSLMNTGRLLASGPAEALLTPDWLSRLYGCTVERLDAHPASGAMGSWLRLQP